MFFLIRTDSEKEINLWDKRWKISTILAINIEKLQKYFKIYAVELVDLPVIVIKCKTISNVDHEIILDILDLQRESSALDFRLFVDEFMIEYKNSKWQEKKLDEISILMKRIGYL